MSGSRARTSNSVSLFPFLAVLVCAMGALIFLLIVTTRRIRSEALARAAAGAGGETGPRSNHVTENRPTGTAARRCPRMYCNPIRSSSGRFLPKEPERIEPIPGVVVLGPSQSTPVLPRPRQSCCRRNPGRFGPRRLLKNRRGTIRTSSSARNSRNCNRPGKPGSIWFKKSRKRGQAQTASRRPDGDVEEDQFAN